MEISAHLETFKVRRNLKVGCRLKEKHKREYCYDNRFKVLHLKKKKKLSWHCFFPFLFFLPFYEAQEPSHMPADKKQLCQPTITGSMLPSTATLPHLSGYSSLQYLVLSNY